MRATGKKCLALMVLCVCTAVTLLAGGVGPASAHYHDVAKQSDDAARRTDLRRDDVQPSPGDYVGDGQQLTLRTAQQHDRLPARPMASPQCPSR